jgi:hypothetical protein
MNLDDSIKQPFSPDSFEFNEAHWDQARLMLDADTARRAYWRKIFLLGFLLVSLTLMTLGILWYNFSYGIKSDENQGRENQIIVLSDEIKGFDEDETAVNSEISDNKGWIESNKPSKLKQSKFSQETSISTSRYVKNSVPLAESYRKNDKKISIPFDNRQINPTGDFNSIEGNTGQEIATYSPHSISDDDELKHNTLIENSSISGKLNQLISVIEEASESTNEISLEIISDNSFKLISKKPSVFFSTEFVAFPTASRDKSEFRYYGFSLGAAYQQPFGDKFFIEVGTRLATRMGEFTPSQRSPQLDFDFVPRNNNFQLRPTAVYSAQLPVYAGYDSERFQLMGGIVPSFLLGVRGRYEYEQELFPWEGSSESVKIETLGNGWLDNSGFKSFALAYVLKYQYKLNANLHVGGGVWYRSGDWVGEDYGRFVDPNSKEWIYTPVEYRDKLSRNWSLSLEIRYRW